MGLKQVLAVFTPVKLTLRRFRDARDGTTAVVFVLCLLPMILVIGLSLDVNRAQSAKISLAAATDATAIAGVRALLDDTKTDADVQAIAQDYFRANIDSIHEDIICSTAPQILVDREQRSVEVISDCTIPTTFTALVGHEAFHINGRGRALRSRNRLEVALMLDLSGSMRGQKLEDLKDASNSAIDILLDPDLGDDVRIGLAPYSWSVNAGYFGARATGVDADGDLFGTAGFDDLSDDFDDDDFDDFDSDDLKRCVSEREGMAAKTDNEPMEDAFVAERATQCPDAWVVPLTSEEGFLEDYIEELEADGATAGHLGIEWSWYILSQDWNAVWPNGNDANSVGTPNLRKAAILMTDGEFNRRYDNSQGNSVQQARDACSAMRSEGITIYSVAFRAPASGEAILRECAADDSRFFIAENGDELEQAYRAIAVALTELRLTD
ncbi:MAG: VWA domain-containing protein [Pseudomonadota bacterium]